MEMDRQIHSHDVYHPASRRLTNYQYKHHNHFLVAEMREHTSQWLSSPSHNLEQRIISIPTGFPDFARQALLISRLVIGAVPHVECAP